IQVHVIGARGSIREQGGDSAPPLDGVHDRKAEFVERQLRNLSLRNRLAVAHGHEGRVKTHGLPSRNTAASLRSLSREGGTYRPRSSTRAMNSTIGPPVLSVSR